MAENRRAEIELAASDRKLRRDLQRSKRAIDGWARDTSGTIAGGFKQAFGQVSGLLSIAGVASLGKSVLDDSRALTRLGIQAEASDEAIRALGTAITGISNDTATLTGELIKGAGEIVTLTGDFALARDSVGLLGKTSKATGADLEDLAGVASDFKNNLEIDATDFEKAFNILIVQGKKGAVELKDLASLLTGLSPQFRALNPNINKGAEGLAELGAALQIAKQGFGTASEAATGLQALFKALKQNAAKFKGVTIFEKDPTTGVKMMRRFSDIIYDISQSELAKNPTKLTKAFGSSEAERAFTQLAGKFEDFQALIDESTGSNAIQADFERYMSSSAGRIEQAWVRMHNAVARQVTPERIESLADAAEGLAEAVGWAADNWKTLAMGMAAFKGAQLAVTAHQFASSISAANASTLGMVSGVKRAGAGLAKGASYAAGIASSLTVGWEVGTLLADALGLNEDPTAASSPAEGAAVMAGQSREHLGELRKREGGLRKQVELIDDGKLDHLPPQRHEKIRGMLAETQAQIQAAEREASHYDAKAASLAITERDEETGQSLADDVLEELRRMTMGKLSDFRPDLAQNEVLQLAAPELQGKSVEQLTRITTVLERQLEEQAKQRQILERVQSTNYPGTPQATAAVPRSGRAPQ